MSETAHPDEIDELVSSVREFVSHKDPKHVRLPHLPDRLVLTAEQRVSDADALQEQDFIEEIDDTDHSNVLVLDAKKPKADANLETTIAELEAAVTAQFDDWEPDEGESFEKAAWAESAFPGGDVDSHLVIEGDDHPQQASAEDETADEPHAPAEEDAQDLETTDLLGDMDKDALRALVVDIVHQELSGELGERITRNVRKLVRREINRVLTSREMGQD